MHGFSNSELSALREKIELVSTRKNKKEDFTLPTTASSISRITPKPNIQKPRPRIVTDLQHTHSPCSPHIWLYLFIGGILRCLTNNEFTLLRKAREILALIRVHWEVRGELTYIPESQD